MAYSTSRQPAPDPSGSQQVSGPKGKWPVLKNIWDTLKAPFSGFWQGFGGKNLTWEQLKREKARAKTGRPPGKHPGRGPVSWLGRVM